MSNLIPRDACQRLVFLFSHAISSIRTPRSIKSLSFMTFSTACVFVFSRSKSSVEVRCTTTLNRASTSSVLLPSSFGHSVLLRAASADSVSLNRITYPVLVVLTAATWASCVVGAFDSAVRIWMFAVSVGRYRPKVFGPLVCLFVCLFVCL